MGIKRSEGFLVRGYCCGTRLLFVIFLVYRLTNLGTRRPNVKLNRVPTSTAKLTD